MSEAALAKSKLLQKLLAAGEKRIIFKDEQGVVRFHESFASAERLELALKALNCDAKEIPAALDVYEATFDHHSFTGRSGTMFAYEGLGSIYWHMVAKLLLATCERTFAAGGLEVLRPARYPANDGAISLGQAAVAMAALTGD